MNRNPQSTGVYDAGGFARNLDLVGGWYDKTVNLASYYTNTLTVGIDSTNAPEITVGTANYDSVCWNPDDLPLAILTSGSLMTGLAAQKAVLPAKSGNVWNYAVTNAMGLTIGLMRPTGVFKGSFKAWFDYGTTVHTSKKIAFEGILTPERADKTDGVEGRGFYLWSDKATTPVTYTYKSSYDFVIQDGP